MHKCFYRSIMCTTIPGNSCLCRAHRREAQRHRLEPEYIPLWKKGKENVHEAVNKCAYPECVATSDDKKIIIPSKEYQVSFREALYRVIGKPKCFTKSGAVMHVYLLIVKLYVAYCPFYIGIDLPKLSGYPLVDKLGTQVNQFPLQYNIQSKNRVECREKMDFNSKKLYYSGALPFLHSYVAIFTIEG